MDKILTPGNIMFILGLIAIMFSVYNYFKKPQDENEIKQVVTEKDLGTKATILAQKEAEGKALLLAAQVQTEKEYNTKQYILMNERFNDTDRKIETLTTSINKMNLDLSKELTRVATVVEEHMKVIP